VIANSTTPGQVGKTKGNVELSVPGDLAKGLVYFQFIKRCLGLDLKPDNKFFLDTKNAGVLL
jgi:hypothetical protein